MTQLIARLVLAMLILPFAVIVMIAAIAVDISMNSRSSLGGVLAAWSVTDVFVIVYWIAIWRSPVKWTPQRQALTVGCVVLAVVGAIVSFGALWNIGGIQIEPAALFGGGIFPIVFVLTTVFAWRETPAERHARVTDRGTDTIACPICGYNMTGLREARCPECGVSFTLDELLTAQSAERREELAET